MVQKALAGLTTRDLERPVLVLVGGIVFYGLIILTDLPSVLPGYPAVILASVIWCVLPGWFVQRALFASERSSLVEQVAVAFVISMALASVPGLLGLWQHWSLTTFAMLYGGLSAAASGIVLLVPPTETDGEADDSEPEAFNVPLLIVLGIALLVLVSSPFWIDDNMPRDGDDLVYMGYVNTYLTDELDASDPIVATREGSFGRMSINVWVVLQAQIADSAGVQPFDLLMDYLPPVMTLFMVMAMFALARTLFGSTTIALLAATFVLAFAALDLSPHTGYGRNVIIRAAQDKMVSTYVLVPVALLLATQFFTRPGLKTYLAAGLAGVALAVVHPMGLLYYGFGLVFFFAARLVARRSWDTLKDGLLVCGPWAVLGIVFLLRVWIVEGFDAEPAERELTFMRELLLTDLPGGLVIGNYHMILHPLFLFAIVLVPVLLLRAREHVSTHLIAGVTLGTLALFFAPPAATALAETASDHALWRLPRLIPVPLVVGAGAYLVIAYVWRRRDAGECWSFSPIVAVALLVVGAIFTQEYFGVVDDGEFYQRVSDQAIVPFAEGSVLLGGYEHIKLGDSRPGDTEMALLEYLDEHAPRGSIVLIPQAISNRYFPGVLEDVRSVDYRGAPGIRERRQFIAAYYDGTLTDLPFEYDVEATLDELSVDFVVVPPRTELDDDARTFIEFNMNEFNVQLGQPELITFEDPPGESVGGWLFDYEQEQRIGGLEFTVPVDLSPADPTLEFIFEATTTGASGAGHTSTIVLTYFEEGVAGTTSVVTELAASEDASAGEPFIIRRPVAQAVEPGTTYSFIVSTLPPESSETQVNQDIALTGLRVKYWPESLIQIGSSGFSIYRR